MTPHIALALLLSISTVPLAATAATAAEEPMQSILREAGDSELSDFHWKKRLVVVFADSPDDPRYIEQMELLRDRPDMLNERDVVVLTDTDPDARSPARMKLRPRGFMMVLMGKDGTVELRKPQPWTIREITRSIDKMPIRRREIDERRGSD